jgi:hypothetical protein
LVDVGGWGRGLARVGLRRGEVFPGAAAVGVALLSFAVAFGLADSRGLLGSLGRL